MSVATLSQAVVLPTEYQPRTRRWTREEYYRAYDIGLFGPTEKLELIRGEIKEKMPQGSRHASAVTLCFDALYSPAKQHAAFVRCQLPLTFLNDSEPEPDLAVVAGSARDYNANHPLPENVLLVVEVSDTTLLYDRTEKAKLYAEAGIPEYWIINVASGYLEVRRDPDDGEYRSLQTIRSHGTIAPLFSSDTPLSAAELLPTEE